MASVPENLKYTKDHEWAKAEGNVTTVGITAFACEQLGELVFVDLPKVGETVKAGGTFGVVESTKSANDLFSPVGGKITEVNDALRDNPGIINEDPYGKGWLIKLQMSNPKELDGLLDAKAYTAIAQH